MGTKVLGVGHYAPKKIITNHYFIDNGIETSNEWITSRTGIQQRRYINDTESSSTLAYNASINCLKNANLSSDKIDLIIVATSTPDYLGFPSTACLLQDHLNCLNTPAFDLSAACSGFCYAITTAENFLLNKDYQNILIVGVDCLSTITDQTDRKTVILFGDAAGAMILSKSKSDKKGLIYSKIYADGKSHNILKIPEGGSKKPLNNKVISSRKHYIEMDGKTVFKQAINTTVPAIKQALKEKNISINDVSYLICHQANERILQNIAEKLNIDSQKLIINLDKYGNTSAASIPLALSEFNQEKGFKKNDILVLIGFGAGFTWGVNIIIWE